MGRAILAVILAYLSGSVLYANVFGALFDAREGYARSADKNPGVANAYKFGGFWCGTLTLICELLKGALPVYFFLNAGGGLRGWALPLVLAAPVAGHIFPVFHDFRGGKGIAVTFGVLLGLFPYVRPVLVLAAVFIFLSVCVRIKPHFYRTIAAYLLTALLLPASHTAGWIWFGFLVITALVCVRMALSHEEKERFEVKLLWMR